MKMRVVLVDDHTSVRQMLACLLQREMGYEVVGEAGTGHCALELCRKLDPKLLILDVVLPELCGVEVMRRLQMRPQRPHILIYTGITDRQRTVEVLKCRPHGFVEKSDSLESLREAIRVVATGGLYFSPFATQLAAETYERSRMPELTAREFEVLQLIAEGRSSKEISAVLDVAVKTVENHRAHLMAKLHRHDVASLTRYAVKLGMVVAE